MKKQLILLCALAFSASLHVTAQSFKKQISARPELSANNYLAYPTPSGKLTPAPSGLTLSHPCAAISPTNTDARAGWFCRRSDQWRERCIEEITPYVCWILQAMGRTDTVGSTAASADCEKNVSSFPIRFPWFSVGRCQVYGCYPLYSVHGKRTPRADST